MSKPQSPHVLNCYTLQDLFLYANSKRERKFNFKKIIKSKNNIDNITASSILDKITKSVKENQTQDFPSSFNKKLALFIKLVSFVEKSNLKSNFHRWQNGLFVNLTEKEKMNLLPNNKQTLSDILQWIDTCKLKNTRSSSSSSLKSQSSLSSENLENQTSHGSTPIPSKSLENLVHNLNQGKPQNLVSINSESFSLGPTSQSIKTPIVTSPSPSTTPNSLSPSITPNLNVCVSSFKFFYSIGNDKFYKFIHISWAFEIQPLEKLILSFLHSKFTPFPFAAENINSLTISLLIPSITHFPIKLADLLVSPSRFQEICQHLKSPSSELIHGNLYFIPNH